jgi:hypothetical protein
MELALQAGIGKMMQDLLHPPPTRPDVPPTEPLEFDRWLRGHLAQLHAEVLTEPVPDRFLRLLEKTAEDSRG